MVTLCSTDINEQKNRFFQLLSFSAFFKWKAVLFPALPASSGHKKTPDRSDQASGYSVISMVTSVSTVCGLLAEVSASFWGSCFVPSGCAAKAVTFFSALTVFGVLCRAVWGSLAAAAICSASMGRIILPLRMSRALSFSLTLRQALAMVQLAGQAGSFSDMK